MSPTVPSGSKHNGMLDASESARRAREALARFTAADDDHAAHRGQSLYEEVALQVPPPLRLQPQAEFAPIDEQLGIEGGREQPCDRNAARARRNAGIAYLAEERFRRELEARGWDTEWWAWERRVPSAGLAVLNHLHADLTGPDLVAWKGYSFWGIDVKTTAFDRGRLPGLAKFSVKPRSLVALEAFKTRHKIPTLFALVEPYGSGISLVTPKEVRDHGYLPKHRNYYLIGAETGRSMDQVFGYPIEDPPDELRDAA